MISLVFSWGKCHGSSQKSGRRGRGNEETVMGSKAGEKEAGGDVVRRVPSAPWPLGEMAWRLSPLKLTPAQSATVSNVICFSDEPGQPPDTLPVFSLPCNLCINPQQARSPEALFPLSLETWHNTSLVEVLGQIASFWVSGFSSLSSRVLKPGQYCPTEGSWTVNMWRECGQSDGHKDLEGFLLACGTSPGAHQVKDPPAMQETGFHSLVWEDSLEEDMATH